MRSILVSVVGAVALSLVAGAASARTAGDPIRLVWSEGDLAGLSTIYGPGAAEPIGFVEYHQTRREDRLMTVRIARFRDGSSDEDSAEARLTGGRLEAVSGHSIMRDTHGEEVVNLHIDVEHGRVEASWGSGSDRHTMDEQIALPKGTYWGPLVFLVLKNFAANAEDGRLVFRTVAPTPKPVVLDLEIVRDGAAVLDRTAVHLDSETFRLGPTVHWTLDPLIRLTAPRATFWMLPGNPPALARFSGPRNYARQEIVIQ